MRLSRTIALSVATAALSFLGPTDVLGQTEGLGFLSFPNSGAAEAQPSFLRGMLLLHSFEYDDAAEAFREAQTVDPDFALAYWGEALTWQRLLWGQDFLDEARAVLAKLGRDPASRGAKAGTPRERAYMAALEALLSGVDLESRLSAFESAMAELHATYPEDDEAAAIYALSILMAGDYGTAATAARAGALVEGVARRNPDHPGAVHYLVHAYDSPEMAPLGLHWARVYSRLAPEADHALHMPSHIFIHLGMFEEVAASNEASTAASYAWVERNGLGVLDLDYHSYQWLSYAYLQLGRRQEAKAIVDSVTVLLEHRDARGRHWNVANGVHVQNVQWGFETGDWSFYEDRGLPEPDPPAGFLGTTLPLYGHGMAAARKGDVETVERVTRSLRVEGPSEASARAMLALQIEAVHALESGDPDRAASLSEEAMSLVDAFPVSSPPLFQPPYEFHGEIMLRAGRVEEAAKAFDRALERFPARARSQLGRARAAAEAGDVEGARRFYRLLLENWQRADRELPELGEANGFAGGSD